MFWNDKRDIAVFRGSATNPMRDDIAYFVNYNNLSGFDVKLFQNGHSPKCKQIQSSSSSLTYTKYDCYTTQPMSIHDEMEYKYQIVIDGYGVRDAYSRQIRYNSVILKQRSKLISQSYQSANCLNCNYCGCFTS